MGEHKELNPPLVTSILTFTCFTAIFLLGKLRDLFRRRITTKDCWNRPIASAPDAWIDVMERSDLGFTRWADQVAGWRARRTLPLRLRVLCSGFRPLHLLETTKRCLNLGSYNYLGFAAADEYCTPRVQSTMAELGVSTCSSRADAGTTPAHLELEELVAEFIGTEAALTFGMGYATNSATIPALAGKGCLIISDALNHASIVAGARASGAKVKVFRHNDPQHLDAVLKDSIAQGQPRTHRPWKKILIIVEGIYSMEGEVCALPEIVAVKKKYGAYLYLDEAHSIGAMGKHGRGVCEHWGVNPRDVDIMMGTFTKSFGSCGGYIAGSHQLVKYLQANSPAHLYATAMSAPSVQQVSSAIRLLRGEDGTTRGRDKVRQLHDNANYLRRRLTEAGLHVLGDWDSPGISHDQAVRLLQPRACTPSAAHWSGMWDVVHQGFTVIQAAAVKNTNLTLPGSDIVN
ncbi:aminotran_1_2 domain-containing protein, partial [Haematococcus lacustris]